MSKDYSLSLRGEAFNSLCADFDTTLRDVLAGMIETEQNTGEINIKVKITLTDDSAPDYTVAGGHQTREVTKPKFGTKPAQSPSRSSTTPSPTSSSARRRRAAASPVTSSWSSIRPVDSISTATSTTARPRSLMVTAMLLTSPTPNMTSLTKGPEGFLRPQRAT